MKAAPISIFYEGRMQCDVRHTASVSRVRTDVPRSRGGQDTSFSPTDLFVSSVGSSIITTMAAAAGRRRLEIRGAKVQIDYAMGEHRVEKLTIGVTVPKRLADDERAVLEDEARRAPCLMSLHPATESEFVFQYIGA